MAVTIDMSTGGAGRGDFTQLDSMDSSGDDVGDGNVFSSLGQTNTSITVEGSASIPFQAKSSPTGKGFGGMYNSGNNWDVSSTHLYIWVRSLDPFDTEANSGMFIRVSSNSGMTSNYGDWDVGGQDTRRATLEGFIRLCVDTTRSYDESSSPPTLTSVDGIAMGGTMLSGSGQNTYFVDSIDEGNVFQVYGGTSGARGTSTQIADTATVAEFGVFKDIGGVFYILSGITFGDHTTGNSYFADTSQVWLFEDQNVSNTLYTMTFQGGSGTVSFEMGTKVGSGITATGFAGNTLVANQAPFSMVATDTDVDTFNLYGCNFLNSSTAGGNMDFQNGSSEILSCLFSQCDVITIRNGVDFRFNTITDSTASSSEGALDLGGANPATDTVRDLQIQNCSKGINLTGTGDVTYDFKNIKFAGNTNDVRVDFPGGSTITINILEGGDTPTIDNVNSSTVNVVASVSVTITVVDTDNNPIEDAQTSVYLTSDDSEILNADTNASGVATTTFSGTTPAACYIRVRKSSTGTRYFNASTTGTIAASTGINTTIVLREDTIVN